MAKRVSASSKKAFTLSKRRYLHAKDFWAPQNQLYGRLIDFALDLGHYRQGDSLSKDRRRTQPKTQRQYNLLRHKASLLLRQMPMFDTHAVQPGADAHAAEVSLRVIENVFNDPLKAYHDPRSRMVWSALAGGRGSVAIDWHPKWGVCFRFVDPRRLHIAPGFTFLHDPRNPFVIEEFPMRRSEVRKMSGWSVPSDLTGDGGSPLDYGGSKEADGIERDQAQHMPGGDEDGQEDPLVTICKCWYREDPYADRTKKETDATLPVEEWHFMDDSMGVRVPFDPSNPIPPVSEATGAPMRLVTSRNEMSGSDEYDKGYLVIFAPNYAGDAPLFEGTWTDGALSSDATLAAFPYMEMVGYRHPLRRTGISDTELTHSLTIVDNSSFRSTFEQMSVAGGVLTALKGSLEDSEGKPFRFSSDPLNIAWAKDRLGLEGIGFHQAPGMNPAMPAFRNMIESQWQHIGTGDTASSLGPDRSKDIAVGTINALQQSGDLPVQLHAQDLGLQEAIGARVVLDYCRAYMGDNVVSWVTDEGEVAYANVRGSDLVPLNVTVRADKDWRQQDSDKMQAMAQFFGQAAKAGLPPAAILIMMQDAGFSSKTIGALSGVMQQAPVGPPSAGSGAGQGGPPPPQAGGNPPLSVVEGGSPV